MAGCDAPEVLGDRAYDSAELREELDERGTKPVIPIRSNRKQPFSFNKRLYKLRWRIENAFNRLKSCASPPVNRMAQTRPFRICDCVYLRVAPSARAANGMLPLPLFRPLPQRCAFTYVESIVGNGKRSTSGFARQTATVSTLQRHCQSRVNAQSINAGGIP